QAFEYSDLRDELAWLVLRVISKLEPCTETSLVAYITGNYTPSHTPTRRFILNALAKLKALGLIQSAAGEIAITEVGRRFLDKLPIDASSPRAPFVALLAVPRLAWLAKRTTRLKRFCQVCFAGVRATQQRARAPADGAPVRDFATLCGMPKARANLFENWHNQARNLLSTVFRTAGKVSKFKAVDHGRLALYGGALLVAVMTTAGGIAFLSSKGGAPTILATEDHAAGRATESKTQSLPSRTEIVRIAVQDRLSRLTSTSERRKREQGTLVEYYSGPKKPLLWVDDNGLTDRAQSVMEEIAKAEEYGLQAADYELPNLDGFGRNSEIDSLADAEVKITFAVLRYMLDARGGRLTPARLTKNLNPTLALPDPLQVMGSIAVQGDPATYLRSFQPSHPQFEALRQELLALRSEARTPKPTVIIPEGPVLKKGVEHAQVALLKKRLEVSSNGGNAFLYGDLLDEAVRRFQTEQGVVVDGVVGAGTREALNQNAQGNIVRQRQILLNMERWRWLPQDLGPLYVNVNVPEFVARVVKDGQVIHTTRVVVGKPNSQTPIFSHKMQEIVFGPYWNVPTSIKVEEIRPYLREEAPWFLGGGWNTSIFRRQGLRVRYGGREVDPGAIDWNQVDIRNLEIFQPPGPNNVLGRVKFVFPNKHDVYMHDTTQKQLFANQVRAESHGCVRVQNPEQLAAILLEYDQAWSAARVESAIQNGYDQHVPLSHTIPVHITYFTLWVNDDGSISSFGDLYGHDARMAEALFGDSRGFDYPQIKVRQKPIPRGNPAPWGEAANTDIVGSIIRLLEN
ncbi:MAG: L,D-transpeptidase family protein, partial [Acidobacteria bacterium]|nr:L,D-transpeptidase family protein [Acidobacteriota bacterium]